MLTESDVKWKIRKERSGFSRRKKASAVQMVVTQRTTTVQTVLSVVINWVPKVALEIHGMLTENRCCVTYIL